MIQSEIIFYKSMLPEICTRSKTIMQRKLYNVIGFLNE